MIRYLCLLLLLSAVAGPLQAQHFLEGRVVDEETGAGLSRAEVVVVGSDRSTLSDDRGVFRLERLPEGSVTVAVTVLGYAPTVQQFSTADVAGGGREIRLRATPLSIPGIQVTGTAGPADPRSVTQATTQISGRALDRALAGSIAQTLSGEPGIRARYNGPAAAAPIMRGLTGDRILLLQDGMRSSDLAGSAVDHTVTIDPLAARRIEVVRGPATLLYGNNALGGVINVISGDIPTSLPAEPEGGLVVRTESAMPGVSVSGRVSASVSDRVSVTARVGGHRAGDVRIGTDPELGSFLPNTDNENWNVGLGTGYLGDGVEGGVSLRGYRFAYGLPIAPGTDPLRLVGDRIEVGSRLRTSLPSAALPSLRTSASVQSYTHAENDLDGVEQMAFGLKTGTLTSVLSQGEVGPFREGAWGVSALVKDYSNTGPGALTPAARSTGLGIFGLQELGLGYRDWAFQFGGRWDHFAVASRTSPKFGPGIDRTFRSVSGSLGVNLPLSDVFTLSASATRSFRAPTVEELFSGALHAGTGAVEYGTADLREERGWGFESVARIRSDAWEGQIVAYQNRIGDYIQLVAQPDTIVNGFPIEVFRYGQTDAMLRGVEVSLQHALSRSLVAGLTGDYLHSRQTDGSPLSFMPAPRLGGTLRWDDGRFSLGSDVHHEFAQTRSGAANESHTDAHRLIDLDAGVRGEMGGTLHAITIRIENLTDVAHRESTSRIKDFAPGPGRNLSVGYRATF